MEALVLEAPGRLVHHRAKEEPREDPGQDCLWVRVAACGVCGSDIPRAFDPGGAYHYPLVLGHEFSGVVEEEGHGWKKGDRAAIFPLLPKPGQPEYETGDYAQTTNYDYFGSRRDGGMQQLLRVPVFNLFRLPDEVSLLHAACTEPAAVALHAVRKLNLASEDTALVVGGGPIGLMAAQWLRIFGAGKIWVADIDPLKLQLAEDLGFFALDSRLAPLEDQVKEATEGRGAAKVIEACGLPSTCRQALACASVFGGVVLMGNLHGQLELDAKFYSTVLRRELTLYGTWNSKVVPRGEDDWTLVLNHMDRDLLIAPLVSDTPLLEEGPEVFASIKEKKKPHNKVIFRVSPELLP